MNETLFLFGTAILVGFVSTLHCAGMCSGIVGALMASLPAEVRQRPRRLAPFVLSYNAGRIASYTAAGGLFGLLSSTVSDFIDPTYGHMALRVTAAGVMIAIGLYIAGWFPQFARVERLGRPLWRRLEPLGRRMLPVKSHFQALTFGMIWGWLPCGMVYSMLLWTATSGSAQIGALVMLGFGLGTLPTVFLAGLLFARIVGLARNPYVRKVAGAVIILVAIITVVSGPGTHRHMWLDQLQQQSGFDYRATH